METRTAVVDWVTENSVAVVAVVVGVAAAAAAGTMMSLPAWFVIGAGLALAAVFGLLVRGMAQPTGV